MPDGSPSRMLVTLAVLVAKKNTTAQRNLYRGLKPRTVRIVRSRGRMDLAQSVHNRAVQRYFAVLEARTIVFDRDEDTDGKVCRTFDTQVRWALYDELRQEKAESSRRHWQQMEELQLSAPVGLCGDVIERCYLAARNRGLASVSRRDAEIWISVEERGDPSSAIAERYRLTPRRVQQIVRQVNGAIKERFQCIIDLLP